MGTYVNTLNAVLSRIQDEMTTGRLLESVKTLYVGHRQLSNMPIDCPFLMVNISSIADKSVNTMKRNATIEIDIVVAYGISDESSTSNLIFDTGSQSGLLYLVEKVGDTFSKSQSGVIDTRFGGTVRITPNFEAKSFARDGNIIFTNVTLVVDTSEYSFNGRSSG